MSDTVGLVDLAEQHAELGGRIEEAVLGILRSGNFVLGEEVSAFEEAWALACGAAHAIGVGSGTDALYLALKASGIGPGDRVVVPDYTFIATYEAVVRCGALPILADVLPETGGVDPASVRAVADEAGGARAVVAVHLYGIPCEIARLEEALEPWDGYVVEDAAQAHGARLGGDPVGGLGRTAAFSFYPTKNLAAAGDGGAVTTNAAEIADLVRVLRDHGREDRYRHGRLGTNSRLDALQAAVLRVKLERLEAWTEQRRRVAGWWHEACAPLGEAGFARLPRPTEGSAPAWHLYPLRVANRAAAQAALDGAGIAHGTHYPLPLHDQPAVQERHRVLPELASAAAWAREIVTLPCHPHVPHEAVEKAAEALAALV